MSEYDLLVRNSTVVTPGGESRADLGVADGHIVAIAPDLTGTSKEEINAGGLHVFPGIIDAHVHFNEPGRTHWEGFATGTAALAAGGTTSYIEMPLNSSPPTLDAESFDLKLKAAQSSSLVDFALWGGLVPGNLEHLDELADRGVVGYKAFMSNSGIADFPMADDLTLYEGMARVAKLGRIVLVHAENDQITSELARRAITQGRTGVRDYLTSRPVLAELEAIERAILFARETGCPLHIVHVSSGRGVSLVVEAQAQGVNVSCETCPHYLVLTEEDVERMGGVAKCSPPIRSREEQESLWQHIFVGTLPMVVSDHSPAPADMKTDAENIAQRFSLLPSKGRLSLGADADMVLVDLQSRSQLQANDLFYRHQHSPYIGRMLRGRIVRTLVRGNTIFLEGKVVSEPIGQFLKPSLP